ncbi:hypothetical protein [Nonomuraea sp. NPDC049141]|uniref:hypothetical protein n=1 Tax=Nonomuraea sp. NPDC049141 TaxID=3155500 RepID=UPI0033D7B484
MTGYPLLTEYACGAPFHQVTVPVTMDRPSFRGQTEFTLRPGTVTDDAVELFGYAHCQALAGAMHELTGWPFAWFERCKDGQWAFTHAGVVTPSGLMLDIHGLRTPEQAMKAIWADIGFDVRWTPLASPPYDVVPWTAWTDASLGSTAWAGFALGVEIVRYFAECLCKEAR